MNIVVCMLSLSLKVSTLMILLLLDSFPGGSGGGGERQQQRAGPKIHVSPPQAAGRSGRQGSVPKPSGRPVLADGCDGSDLDISDSLPHDNCSPVLVPRTAQHPVSPPQQQKAQPVYAVVKKKKNKKCEDTSAPVAAPKTHSRNMTDAPRSPGKIPLIRISQTESVEQADKNAPLLDDPPSKQQQV